MREITGRKTWPGDARSGELASPGGGRDGGDGGGRDELRSDVVTVVPVPVLAKLATQLTDATSCGAMPVGDVESPLAHQQVMNDAAIPVAVPPNPGREVDPERGLIGRVCLATLPK
jgi:hypothetical protein